MARFHIERDSMGEVKVPEGALFGPHTQRSLQNFSISSLRFQSVFLKSMLSLKRACALANRELGELSAKQASAIVKAIDGLQKVPLDAFPLDVFQAGSGTSLHMNVNEVIAKKAGVHPNDQVNRGQSTNNVFPSAIRVSLAVLLPELRNAVHQLANEFGKKSREYREVLKAGRTHLQDAVPMTIGQEFGAYASALEKHLARIAQVSKEIVYLGIGGNAIGTGVNTHPEFRKRILHFLNQSVPCGFRVAKDGIETTQFLTDIAAVGAVVRLIACDLTKIGNDLRLLSSGPNTGLAELKLPPVEPGSSIMPGKVNPSIVEAVNMASLHVQGRVHTVDLAVQAGQLELNTHMPIVAFSSIDAMEVLTNALSHLAVKCVRGLKVDVDKLNLYVEQSAALATALNPVLGYDAVAQLVKESLKKGKTVKQLVVAKGILSEEEVVKYLNPKYLTKPNVR